MDIIGPRYIIYIDADPIDEILLSDYNLTYFSNKLNFNLQFIKKPSLKKKKDFKMI